jgi:hypothetical protein
MSRIKPQRPSALSLAVLTATLFLLPTAAWAQDIPAMATVAASVATPPASGKNLEVPLSVVSGTQGNFGLLGIGVGYVGGGAYLDETGALQSGLHASLGIGIEGAPELATQPDVREGQTLVVAGYHILVEKIVPGDYGGGTVILRAWAPPR